MKIKENPLKPRQPEPRAQDVKDSGSWQPLQYPSSSPVHLQGQENTMLFHFSNINELEDTSFACFWTWDSIMLPSNTNEITYSFQTLLTHSLAMWGQHPGADGEARFPSVRVSTSRRKILAETSRTSTHPKSRLYMQNNTHSAGGLDPTILCSGVWLPSTPIFHWT